MLECCIPDPQQSSSDSHFIGCFRSFDFLDFCLYHTRKKLPAQEEVFDKNTNPNLYRTSKFVELSRITLTWNRGYSMIQNCGRLKRGLFFAAGFKETVAVTPAENFLLLLFSVFSAKIFLFYGHCAVARVE